jgi:endonuclease/exonuclease/phosphatase family metal-dependent hydrolase
MRIMSYNILHGGTRWPSGRLTAIAAVIRSCAPDLLAVQEALDFDTPEFLQGFCADIGLPFAALARGAVYGDGLRYHVILCSKYPILSHSPLPEDRFQSAAQIVEINTPDFGPLTLCNLHLHAYSDAARLAELQTILEASKSRPLDLILGDFNATSRCDAGDHIGKPHLQNYAVTDRLGETHVDLFASAAARSYPTDLPPDTANTDPDLHDPRRIDYIFASPHMAHQCHNTTIHKAPQTHVASDHFPIFADFEPVR